MAQRQENGVWVYKTDTSYGTPRVDFREWVMLPEGAHDISLQVQGEMEHECQNGRRIFVNTYRDANDPFKFTVEYRLPIEKAEEVVEKTEKTKQEAESTPQ
jgi:hypothetical protein